MADLLTTAGANRVLALDLHSGQIQGFFNILVDNIFATLVLVDYMKKKNFKPEELCAVSPDAGGVRRARYFAKEMKCSIAIVDKRRDKHNEAIAEYLIGDVKDKICILFDDIIDTAGTICEAAKLLKKEGAKEVYVCAVHPVFSGPALQRLDEAPIEEVVVTNSIPLAEGAPKKITQLSVAPILGEAISRIHDDESISSLFGFEKEYKG